MKKVKYIGTVSPWVDSLGGSGLTWTTGMKAVVSEDVGDELTGYPALFEAVAGFDGNGVTPEKVEQAGDQASVSGGGLDMLRRAMLAPQSQRSTMATPPTITVGAAGAASAISGAVDITYNDVRLTYSTRIAAAGTVSPDIGLAKPAYMDRAATGSVASMDGLCTGFTFATSAAAFEVRAKGFSRHRVWVMGDDGVWRALPEQLMASTGSVYRVLYDFGGSRKNRRIFVQFTSAVGGISIAATDAVIPYAPKTPKFLVCGDSITEGTVGSGSSSVLFGYAQQLGELLGCPCSVICVGLGGTGYVATNGGTRKNALDIVQSSVIDNAPDVVVWAHGLNDASDLTANAAGCFDAVRAALPNTLQVVFAPFQPRSITGIAARRTELLAVCAARPWLRVWDNTTYGGTPEVTGTGRSTSPNGTGTSDWWTGGDGTHPTVEGHDHSAMYRASAIRILIGA